MERSVIERIRYMPKRSVDRPNLMSKYEKARVDQGVYDQMVRESQKQPNKPVYDWRKDNYGVKEAGK